MAAAAVSAWWNWRAALAFLLCLCAVRGIVYFELKPIQLWLMLLYSVAAVVALFFVDRVVGGFFAIISLLLGISLLGVMPRHAQIVTTEIALILGVVTSAWNGPSGGLYHYTRHTDRPDTSGVVSAFDMASDRRRD